MCGPPSLTLLIVSTFKLFSSKNFEVPLVATILKFKSNNFLAIPKIYFYSGHQLK